MSQPFRKAAHKLKRLARNAIADSSWNIYRGDRVVVTRGRDRGQTGVVREVDREAVVGVRHGRESW